MSAKAPVKDWAVDFDHTDPVWNNDPYPIWDELRKRCPIAHSERFEDGAFFPSRPRRPRPLRRRWNRARNTDPGQPPS